MLRPNSLHQGTIRRGDNIVNVSTGKKIKVPRLVRMHANEMEDVDEGKAGDIIALFGVDCSTGTTFTDGTTSLTMTSMFVPEAVMSLAIKTAARDATANFNKALARFVKEDPTFRVTTNPETQETVIAGMGELHLQIYVERMRREYGVECTVGQPAVAFRETVLGRVDFDYLHKKQSGGSGQYGRVIGYVEPLEEGVKESFVFENHMVGSAIPPEFLPAIQKGFNDALTKGPLTGHPVTGLRVVLTDGAAHAVDSNEIAFKLAAVGAFRQSFEKGKPAVLEPVMTVEIEAPSEFQVLRGRAAEGEFGGGPAMLTASEPSQGTVVGQINQRKGVVSSVETREGMVTAVAEVPLDNMFGYSTDLRSVTQGKGEFSMEYCRHAMVPREKQEELVEAYRKSRAAGEDSG